MRLGFPRSLVSQAILTGTAAHGEERASKETYMAKIEGATDEKDALESYRIEGRAELPPPIIRCGDTGQDYISQLLCLG